MATEKQRRRREKEKRHGIEIVEIDEDGNERVVEASELRPAAPPARVKGKSTASGKQSAARRPVQPPSWKRALKRGAVVGPLFLAFIFLVGKKGNLAAQLIPGLFMLVIFVPFSYYMDKIAYRRFQKGSTAGNSRSRR